MKDEPRAAAHAQAPSLAGPKRSYAPPTLVVFGQVAALTQAQTGCSNNDSSTCAVGATMGPMLSDRAFKDNICRVGTHPLGIGLYLFDYKVECRDQWGHGRQFGVMADEVELVMPQAVTVHPDGYRMVRYGMLGMHQAH